MRRLLQDVPLGAGLEAAGEQAALAVGREHEHVGLGHLGGDLAGGLEPVGAGHPDVHDHDVRAAAAGQRNGGTAVRRLADNADVVRAGQRQAQALTNDLMIIDNQTGNRLGHVCSTRRIDQLRV